MSAGRRRRVVVGTGPTATVHARTPVVTRAPLVRLAHEAEPGRRLPTSADGARTARTTDALVRASRTRTRVEAPA